jgi:peptide chain release factor 1
VSEKPKEWPECVDESQIRIDWFSGQGGGGQNRNKNQNCCRMTHVPTGIQATGQDGKSRAQNKKDAFNRLAEKLIPLMKAKLSLSRDPPNRERIRTYHEKRGTVVDHRVPGKSWPLKDVLDGDLNDMIAAVQKKLMEDTE